MTTRDLVSMDRVSDPQVSPDGRQVAFVLSEVDLDADRRRTDIWLVGVDGGDPLRLTSDPAADFNPRWAPDGAGLYFLSTRSGSSQVWRVTLDGETAIPITDLPLDLSNLTLSPDASHLAFSIEVFADCPTLDCTAARLEERQAAATTGQLYDRGFVRHWDTWEDGRRSHLFVMPVTGGAPVDLMAGIDGDSPSVPFGGAEEFAFTPDGRSLVLTSRPGGPDEPWSTNFDLWLAPIDGSRRAPEPDRGQRRLGHGAGVLSGWADARLSGDGAARLRSGTASASCCGAGRTARRARLPRTGTARPAGCCGRRMAPRSMRPPRTSGTCRCSRSTSPAAG